MRDTQTKGLDKARLIVARIMAVLGIIALVILGLVGLIYFC